MTFKPLPWMTVFTVLGLGVLIFLGSWQLDRLAWKVDLLDRLSAQLDAQPKPIDLIGIGSGEITCEDFQFTTVRISGRWTGTTAYVYAVRESKPARQIFRPLVRADGSVIVINLGYVPFERPDLAPSLPADQKDVNLAGMIRCPQKPGMVTPAPDFDENLWFVADLPAMAPVLAPGDAQALSTGYYIQRLSEPGSDTEWPRTRDPEDMISQIPNNHLGYALTWFGLAAVLLVIYIVFHVNQGRLRIGT